MTKLISTSGKKTIRIVADCLAIWLWFEFMERERERERERQRGGGMQCIGTYLIACKFIQRRIQW